MEIPSNKKNYLRNTKTSKERVIRMEIIGEVSDKERHFLDGISLFLAGTMASDDVKHKDYVADKMIQLVREVVAKMKAEREAGK